LKRSGGAEREQRINGSPAIDGGRGLKQRSLTGALTDVEDRPPSMAGAD